jgi:hypothetical protein
MRPELSLKKFGWEKGKVDTNETSEGEEEEGRGRMRMSGAGGAR